MLIIHSECSRSTFFKILPFLTSDDFESFRSEMRSALIGAKDPMENSLDVVVPGLVRLHQSHQDSFLHLNAGIKKMQEEFMEKIHELSKETKLDRPKSAYQLSVSLQKLSESYSTSFESDLNKFTNLMASTLKDETGNSINVNDSNLNVNATVNDHSSVVDSSNNGNSSRLLVGTNNKIQDDKVK